MAAAIWVRLLAGTYDYKKTVATSSSVTGWLVETVNAMCLGQAACTAAATCASQPLEHARRVAFGMSCGKT